jgi:hypothetical protein
MAKEDYFWTQKNGVKSHIKDLETSHLLNICKLLEKNNYTYTTTFYIEDYGCDKIEHCLYNLYENIRIELRLRKLEGS